MPTGSPGTLLLGQKPGYCDQAYDEAKYGHYSKRPYLNIVLPSLVDPSVAPPGKHVLSAFVQYAPYQLADGLDWDSERDAFGETVIDTIEEYAPSIRKHILHKQVLTPLDLERLRTYSIGEREHLVSSHHMARPVDPGASLAEFLDALPPILAVERLRELAEAMATARAAGCCSRCTCCSSASATCSCSRR